MSQSNNYRYRSLYHLITMTSKSKYEYFSDANREINQSRI